LIYNINAYKIKLYIDRAEIDAHKHGKLWASSRRGKGTGRSRNQTCKFFVVIFAT